MLDQEPKQVFTQLPIAYIDREVRIASNFMLEINGFNFSSDAKYLTGLWSYNESGRWKSHYCDSAEGYWKYIIRERFFIASAAPEDRGIDVSIQDLWAISIPGLGTFLEDNRPHASYASFQHYLADTTSVNYVSLGKAIVIHKYAKKYGAKTGIAITHVGDGLMANAVSPVVIARTKNHKFVFDAYNNRHHLGLQGLCFWGRELELSQVDLTLLKEEVIPFLLI